MATDIRGVIIEDRIVLDMLLYHLSEEISSSKNIIWGRGYFFLVDIHMATVYFFLRFYSVCGGGSLHVKASVICPFHIYRIKIYLNFKLNIGCLSKTVYTHFE